MSIPSSDFPTSSSSPSTSMGGSDMTSTGSGGATSGSTSPQAMVDRLAQTAHEAIDRVAGAAGPAVEKLRTSFTGAGDKLHGQADTLRATGDEWMESCRHTVREHPLAAVGTALLAGWLIGRILRD